MLFNYLTLIFEILAHVFRALGTCIFLLPFAYFAGMAAFALCNGLSVILGVISVASVILAVALAYMEVEQAVERVSAFNYWRAVIKNA